MTTSTTASDNIEHAFWCQPQPGQPVRSETYTAPRPGPDGITVIANVRIHRCQECGNATYDGVPEQRMILPANARQATTNPAAAS